jgi:hypothetical protein
MVMPLGICNVPAMFERIMETEMSPMSHVSCTWKL